MTEPEASLYDELGVRPGASEEALRAAYRRQARLLHPDVAGEAGSGEAMGRLNQAWAVLGDPRRRREYDRSRALVRGDGGGGDRGGGGPAAAATPAASTTPTTVEPATEDAPDDGAVGARRPRFARPSALVLLILAALFLVTAYAGSWPGDRGGRAGSTPPPPPDTAVGQVTSAAVVGECLVDQAGQVAVVACSAPNDGQILAEVTDARQCPVGTVAHAGWQPSIVLCAVTSQRPARPRDLDDGPVEAPGWAPGAHRPGGLVPAAGRRLRRRPGPVRPAVAGTGRTQPLLPGLQRHPGQDRDPDPARAGGVVVPACTYEYVNNLYVTALHPTSYHFGDFFRTAPGCATRPGQFVPIENTAVNSPVSYLPAELVILPLRVAGAPVPVIFFAGRLAGLAVYLALIFLAIRVTPRGKAVFVVLALLPSSLELASGYSADGMTIALAFLSIALVLRALVDDDVGPKWFLALAASLAALVVTKNTYFVLAPLILLFPSKRLGWSPRAAIAAKGAALAGAAIVAGGWYLAVRNVSLAAYAPPGTVITPHVQIHYILHHPIGYAHILARSIFLAAPENYFIPGFVQSMGFFRNGVRGSALAPVGLVVIATLVLAAAYRSDTGPGGSAWRPWIGPPPPSPSSSGRCRSW